MTFSETVWALTRQIPRGRVTTYQELARAMKTRAYRAVGNALNKNPYAPHVPCHRVVKTDGSLGGFAQGPQRKRALLEKEGISIRKDRIQDFSAVLFRF